MGKLTQLLMVKSASSSSSLLPLPSYPRRRFTLSRSHVEIHRPAPIVFSFHSARSSTFVLVRARIGAWSLAARADAIVRARLTCAVDHTDACWCLLLLLHGLLLMLKGEVLDRRRHAMQSSRGRYAVRLTGKIQMYAVCGRNEMVRGTLSRGKLVVCGYALLLVVHGGIETLLGHLLTNELALVLEVGRVLV